MRSGVDGFLDVARQTFCRVTEQAGRGRARPAFQPGAGPPTGQLTVPCPLVCNQVHELADHLRQQHNLPGMRVHYAAKRGFYFSLGPPGGGRKNGRGHGGSDVRKHPRHLENGRDEEPSELQPAATARDQGGGGSQGGRSQPRVPPGFLVLQHTGRAAHVTTSELNALNARLRDASNDCIVLTEQASCQSLLLSRRPPVPMQQR